jgi:hypothetical protein
MIAAFEGQDAETKIFAGEIAVDDAMKIAGLFFPPLAVAANDLEIAIAVEQFALPVIKPTIAWLASQPPVKSFLQSVSAGVGSLVNSIKRIF